GRAHVGPRVGCARGAPRTLYGGRPAAVSDGPRATQPKRGDGPTEDHAEGAVAEEPAVTPGRPGAALSGIASVLALSRTVDYFSRTHRSILIIPWSPSGTRKPTMRFWGQG